MRTILIRGVDAKTGVKLLNKNCTSLPAPPPGLGNATSISISTRHLDDDGFWYISASSTSVLNTLFGCPRRSLSLPAAHSSPASHAERCLRRQNLSSFGIHLGPLSFREWLR